MRYENGLFYRFQYGKWKLKKTVFHHNYYRLQIMTNKICKDYYVQRIVYWLNNPAWDKNNTKMQIDHRDGNTKNNDITNLRLVTPQENTFNKNAKGYTWNKRAKKYYATICVSGKKIHLGCFDDKVDARAAYLTAKAKYHIIQVRS
jgi:hypothetical protein